MRIEILIAILTGGFAVIAAIVSPYVARSFERRRDVELSIRNNKIPVYLGILGLWSDMLLRGKSMTPEQFERNRADLQSKVMKDFLIWSSAPVLNAYGDFLGTTRESAIADPVVQVRRNMLALARVWLEVRSDLGHRDKVGEETLLRMIITDYDKLFDAKLQV